MNETPNLEIYCKAWPVRDSKYFHKQAFNLDWERQTIQCPAKQEMPFAPGGMVHFPQEVCAECPLKSQCQGFTPVTGLRIKNEKSAWLPTLLSGSVPF